MTTQELHAALARRFDDRRGWALLYEMSPAGYAKRRVDAMAFCIWPSRGLEVHGVEIKASRSDWLVELKKPEKAEQSAYCYCDKWWIAVTDAEIVKEGELPSTWGLLVPRGRTLIAKVKAPQLTPKPVDRLLLARVLHRLGKENPLTSDRLRIEYQRGLEAGESLARGNIQIAERDKRMAEERLAKVRSDFVAFEKAAGLQLGGWNLERITKLGESAARLLRNEEVLVGARHALVQAQEKLQTAVEWLGREIADQEGE